MKRLVWLIAVLLICSCDSSVTRDTKPTEQIRLQLKWRHQAQFAGFYVAQANGMYAREGLDVQFLEGGKDVDPATVVSSGQAEFAVVPPEAVLADRQPAERLTALAVIYQRSAVFFAARKSSGIVRPRDFTGKVIAVGHLDTGGFTDAYVQYQALLKIRKIDPKTITVAPYDPSYTGFLAGAVDVTPTYLTGGVIKLRQKGIELNLVWPGDYGIDSYSDTVVCRNDYLTKNRDIALRFIRGSLAGWRYSIEHAEEAVDIVMRYSANPRETEQKMHEAQIPLIHTGDHPLGWMEPRVWQEMLDLLLQYNQEQIWAQSPNDLFTLDLLHDIYGQVPP